MRRLSFGLTDRGAIHKFRAVGKIGIGGDHVVVACDSVRSADVLRGVVELYRKPPGAANAPVSVAQIALYQGADREKLLIEGAKKEGQVVFYNSHTWFKAVAQEFEKNIHSSKSPNGAPTAPT